MVERGLYERVVLGSKPGQVLIKLRHRLRYSMQLPAEDQGMPIWVVGNQGYLVRKGHAGSHDRLTRRALPPKLS